MIPHRRSALPHLPVYWETSEMVLSQRQTQPSSLLSRTHWKQNEASVSGLLILGGESSLPTSAATPYSFNAWDSSRILLRKFIFLVISAFVSTGLWVPLLCSFAIHLIPSVLFILQHPQCFWITGGPHFSAPSIMGLFIFLCFLCHFQQNFGRKGEKNKRICFNVYLGGGKVFFSPK